MATRTERVVLEYESGITTGAARDAAAIALLKRELGGLDGSNKKATKSTKDLGTETDRLSTRAVKGRNEIDRLSGRLTVLAQVAAGLGPALVPIGAVGVPAAAALANELAGVGLAGGTALLAFHDMGSALTALNKAALDPTVTNLNAAQLALDALPKSAREFARELAAMQPTMLRLREAAAQGLFPGLEESLNQLRTRADDVERIVFKVGTVLGELSKRGTEALAGPEWDDFFQFVAREAPRALSGMGVALGKVIHGLAQLWMAFAPLNRDFTNLIVDAADGFDRWASGLAKTEGFTNFIAYLRENGPLVADAVVAIGNAVLKIVEAAAPLGGPILQALTGIANAIATIADSPAGPTILATVTALSLLARAQATFGKISATSWVQAIKSADTYQAKLAAARGPAIRGGLAIAGLGVAASGVADKFGLANTATLALTGSLAGPWGAAAGAAAGLLLDLGDNSSHFKVNTQDLTDTLDKQTGAITRNTRAYVAQQLQQQGILDAASRLGLNLDDVTRAALGNEAALASVTQAVNDYIAAATAPEKVGTDSHGNPVLVAPPVSPDDRKDVDAVTDAVGAMSGAVTDAKGNVGQLNLAMGATGDGFDTARSAAERFRNEIDRVNAVLEHRASLRDYQQALDDFADRAKQRGDIMVQIAQAQHDLVKADTASEKQAARERIQSLQEQADALKNSLDITTQAGRDTQSALDDIAKSAIAAAQTMKGIDQARFLAQARKDFLNAADAAGLTQKAAENLATQLGLVDRIRARPRIDAEFDEAVGGIARVKRDLDNLPKEKVIRIRTTFTPTTGGTQIGLADGGPVPGIRQPYGDKVLAALAPGEFVVSNRHGQADQHRDLLRAINARRYADGGTVAASRVSVNVAGATLARGGSQIDYGQLASAMAALRPAPPLYGDVHITGDPAAFRRELDRDRAMAEVSGVRR